MKANPGDFYKHYKHDPSIDKYNYVYQVVNIGLHTEEDGQELVIYRPLYEAYVYRHDKMYDVRPRTMFEETIEKDGKVIERFTLVTDADEIADFTKKVEEMY
ncbi:DUF1653 domain-containing protein [Candidatus Nomurabacteria bacterium]|nr:DUF1653 domain-containing protein [Candidatus Nomurabacteria bacterium]MCB9820709.1 DUF1653 domain-containing protein [Candidatus Nomurabacteria bacterium]